MMTACIELADCEDNLRDAKAQGLGCVEQGRGDAEGLGEGRGEEWMEVEDVEARLWMEVLEVEECREVEEADEWSEEAGGLGEEEREWREGEHEEYEQGRGATEQGLGELLLAESE